MTERERGRWRDSWREREWDGVHEEDQEIEGERRRKSREGKERERDNLARESAGGRENERQEEREGYSVKERRGGCEGR